MPTAGPPPPQWPAQGCYPDQGHAPQAGQGYHFPPSDPDPNYGYNQQVYAPQQWGQQGDQRAYDLANYLPAEPGPFQHHQPQAYAETDAEYDEELFEDEEPRRGRRWILIAAALVGAIGVGGALAYTYRSIVAPNSGRVPLVKAEPNVKVKPENRGGREFPGTDRVPNRLGEGVVPPTGAGEGPAGGEKNLGPRAVKTIPIGSQPAAVAPPEVAVPGITLQNFPPPRAEAPAEAPPKAAEPPPTGRLTIGEPPPPAEADDPPPPAKAPPVRRPPVVARAAPPPRPKAPPPPAASAGIGYVAVLSSQKSHIDALKAFADVAEKYPKVLSGKTPDVQEANLGEKGIWYRAVVGPPGSRDAAVGVCSDLKSAGHPDCWVKPY